MAASAKRHRATFRTFYILYVLILLILLLCVFFYVRKTMIAYENSGSEQTALTYAEEAGRSGSPLAKYLNDHCFSASSASGELGDPAARKARFESTVSRAKLSVAPAAGSYDAQHPVYNVFADGKPFLTLGLRETGTETKLGIMTLSKWEIESCVLRAENADKTNLSLDADGGYSCSVTAPYDFTVLFDGKAVTAEPERSPIDDFQYVAPFTAVPEMATWTFEGLSFEPTVTVVNNAGESVALTEKNGSFTADATFASTKAAEELGSKAVNALAIGELWSKFMTNDVGGEYHGLWKVRNDCLLLKNSDLYQRATDWANGIDITFVSGHSIDSWTNEFVSNYILYSGDFFSCDVYFEKNMTLKTGAKRTDVFHNRMFFVYNRDEANGYLGWRLADMYSL